MYINGIILYLALKLPLKLEMHVYGLKNKIVLEGLLLKLAIP